MVDSERLRTSRAGLRLVASVAAALARRADGHTSVLAVTTYFPVDVDSVARVFEGLEQLDGIARVERGPLVVHRIDAPGRFIDDPDAIDNPEFVDDSTGFMKAVGALKRDDDWVHRVKSQHELLRIAAGSDDAEVELSYLTSRASMSRARVQSLLNDFDAQGYIGVQVDEEVDAIRYQFPPLEYPQQRFDHNMRRLEEAEPPARSRFSGWIVLAVIAVVVLVVVMMVRL